MGLNVAFQMDPIEHINIVGDSSFALILEAQARGHRVVCYRPEALHWDGQNLLARGRSVTVRDEIGNHFDAGAPQLIDLTTQDIILLRQDPPFDMAYLTTTYLLEMIRHACLILNDPTEVRNAPEKIFVAQFAEFMPPTAITRNLEDAHAFRAVHGDIIIKPLYGNGGAGIFHLSSEDNNLNALWELFTSHSREPIMLQKYLPEIRSGDKRIILVDGEAVGAINRVPASGETRANLHVGGRAELASLTARDRAICARLGPELRRRGLLFVGIDVIGDWLTEINVTSPTGIREIKKLGGPDIAALLWDVVEQKTLGPLRHASAAP